MTLEEAKKIRVCNGRGYSYVDFIKALQLTEPEKSKENKETDDDTGRKSKSLR